MADRMTPYRPFTSFLPYDLKEVSVSNPNGEGYFDPLNSKIDLEWGGTRTDNGFNNYYDYFFSGEDIRVFIDGLFDDADELDMASMAYVIKQEKQPLYGFWSYNYDAMMIGTRLITGEFSVYSRYPRRMTELLEKASAARMESSNANPSSNVMSTLGDDYATKDDQLNIQKYWTSSQLDRITTDPQSLTLANIADPSHNIFSAHPPFNLVVFYGLEELAVTDKVVNTYDSANNINAQLNSDRILATDYNERKSLKSITSPMKIVLQHVNLISMSASYNSGGQPLVENYQFIARDFYFTNATQKDNPLKGSRKVTVPDSTESKNAKPNSKTSTTTSGTKSA